MFGGNPTKTPKPFLTTDSTGATPLTQPNSNGTVVATQIPLSDPSVAPSQMLPTPNPSNSYNELAAAQAKANKARGRLGTIYTSNYGIAPNQPVSLAKKMLTAA